MSVAEDIKSRLDIVSYIGQFVSLKKAGRHYKACCPFHNERTPSFIVNAETQTWRCFGACAEGGDIFSFAMKRNGWTFSEALQELGALAGVDVRKQTPQQRAQQDQHDRLRTILKTAAEVYHDYLVNHPHAESVLRYVCEKRGLSEDTIHAFAIGYAPDGWQNLLEHLTSLGYTTDELIEAGLVIKNENGRVYDRFRNRLMIPIRDDRGRVVGFGGRAINPDDNPKYLNSPQSALFDKSRLLFGLDRAKNAIRESETVVIVEGYMDAIQAHQAGYANVVAQMGTALTQTQLRLVVPRYAKRIILALDADVAGQSATRRSLEVARDTLQADYSGRLSVEIRILQIPEAKDPDDFLRETPEAWPQLLENALPVADFLIEQETAHLPQGDGVARVSIIERESIAQNLLPLLMATTNDVQRQDNVQKLAVRLRIAEKNMLAMLEAYRQAQAKNAPPKPIADSEEPPLWDEDSGFVAVPPPQPAKPASSGARHTRAIESYCLRLLLLEPSLLFQMNRKLRELAGVDDRLRDGPLAELSADDFIEPHYRALMQAFEQALQQDECEPLDYLRQNLDEYLHETLETLLMEDTKEIQQRMRGRLSGELNPSWSYYERNRVHINWEAEGLDRVLELRLRRIVRENEELRFLQLEPDDDPAEWTQRIHYNIQAKGRIDVEINKIRNPLNRSGYFGYEPADRA